MNNLKKYINELDDDLKNFIIDYNNDNKTLLISNFESTYTEYLEISYLANVKKFLIKTELETFLVNSLNYKISINGGYDIVNFSNIIFYFYTDNHEISFYLTRKRIKDLDYDTLTKINKESKLHFIDLVNNHYKDDFQINYWQPYFRNKVKQIKKVIDEFIKCSLNNKNITTDSVHKL